MPAVSESFDRQRPSDGPRLYIWWYSRGGVPPDGENQYLSSSTTVGPNNRHRIPREIRATWGPASDERCIETGGKVGKVDSGNDYLHIFGTNRISGTPAIWIHDIGTWLEPRLVCQVLWIILQTYVWPYTWSEPIQTTRGDNRWPQLNPFEPTRTLLLPRPPTFLLYQTRLWPPYRDHRLGVELGEGTKIERSERSWKGATWQDHGHRRSPVESDRVESAEIRECPRLGGVVVFVSNRVSCDSSVCANICQCHIECQISQCRYLFVSVSFCVVSSICLCQSVSLSLSMVSVVSVCDQCVTISSDGMRKG